LLPSCAPEVMLRYVYSALLLAVAKPACDYVIKLINKNTNARIDDATTEILNQLKRRFEELQKEVRELVSENNNGEAQIAEARRLIAACNDEISRSRKRLSPVKVRDTSEIRKIQQDIADVRKLVLENCTVLDSSDMQKVQDDVSCLQKMVETCKEEIVKSRTAAHDDAKSLHDEHVQIYKALKF
jgi:chromosome segregation ATPase